jgi:hypothetical protein
MGLDSGKSRATGAARRAAGRYDHGRMKVICFVTLEKKDSSFSEEKEAIL